MILSIFDYLAAETQVYAGLNEVSAALNRFKPLERPKQIFAGKNPTLCRNVVTYKIDKLNMPKSASVQQCCLLPHYFGVCS